jgi:sugar lactone lactonase YvrE
VPEPQILLSSLAIGESPRWHEGRLWFSNWGTQEIVAVDLEGNSEVVGEGPRASGGPPIGWLMAACS